MTVGDVIVLLLEGLAANWWVILLFLCLCGVVWVAGQIGGSSCKHYEIGSAGLAQAMRQKRDRDEKPKTNRIKEWARHRTKANDEQ
jgi:hypothetical protein